MLTNYILDNVVVNYVVHMYKDNPHICFRSMGMDISAAKIAKALEISQLPVREGGKRNFFVVERGQLDAEAQGFLYQKWGYERKRPYKDTWTIAVIGNGLLLMNTNEFVPFRLFEGFLMHIEMAALGQEIPDDDECMICFGNKYLATCFSCTACYCDKCMRKAKLKACVVCKSPMRLEVSKRDSFSVTYENPQVLLLKERALVYVLSKIEKAAVPKEILAQNVSRELFFDFFKKVAPMYPKYFRGDIFCEVAV